MNRTGKILALSLCAAGAVLLAWLSIRSVESYWVYLMLAGLLGVAAGVIKNLPERNR
jgi:hypothetical protein